MQFLYFFFYHQRFAFFFFNQGDLFVFQIQRKKKNIFYIQSFSVSGRLSQGLWREAAGSRWISEIHLCTNAYFLREGNFLQLCSPAHSYSPSLVTHQCSWECIVLWLMPKEREDSPLFARSVLRADFVRILQSSIEKISVPCCDALSKKEKTRHKCKPFLLDTYHYLLKSEWTWIYINSGLDRNGVL